VPCGHRCVCQACAMLSWKIRKSAPTAPEGCPDLRSVFVEALLYLYVPGRTIKGRSRKNGNSGFCEGPHARWCPCLCAGGVCLRPFARLGASCTPSHEKLRRRRGEASRGWGCRIETRLLPLHSRTGRGAALVARRLRPRLRPKLLHARERLFQHASALVNTASAVLASARLLKQALARVPIPRVPNTPDSIAPPTSTVTNNPEMQKNCRGLSASLCKGKRHTEASLTKYCHIGPAELLWRSVKHMYSARWA
jgi:hypothetical protein